MSPFTETTDQHHTLIKAKIFLEVSPVTVGKQHGKQAFIQLTPTNQSKNLYEFFAKSRELCRVMMTHHLQLLHRHWQLTWQILRISELQHPEHHHHSTVQVQTKQTPWCCWQSLDLHQLTTSLQCLSLWWHFKHLQFALWVTVRVVYV